MIALPGLAKYSRRLPRFPREAPEGCCEICSAGLAEGHAHVVDLRERKMRCVCAACGYAFKGSTKSSMRTVPKRVSTEPGFELCEEEWSALQIPVRLAFVLNSRSIARWLAIYPSPGGAVESPLEMAAVAPLLLRSALFSAVEPDVEAILVHSQRPGDPFRTILAPIDLCYELVGRVRRTWRGFDGGDEVRTEIQSFLERLEHSAAPIDTKGGAHAPD